MQNVSQRFDQLVIRISAINGWWLLTFLAVFPFVRNFVLYYAGKYLGLEQIVQNPIFAAIGSNQFKQLMLVVIGPLVETLIFQMGLLALARRLFKGNQLIAVAFSSVIFALDHRFSIGYFVAMLVMGYFFALIYLAKRTNIADRESPRVFVPFAIVAGGHALGNGVLSLVRHSNLVL